MKWKKKKGPSLGFIKFLLLLIVIGFAYLCFVQYQEKQSVDPRQRILIVDVIDREDSLSDRTQVQNALECGGMIKIKIDSDCLDLTFDPERAN